MSPPSVLWWALIGRKKNDRPIAVACSHRRHHLEVDQKAKWDEGRAVKNTLYIAWLRTALAGRYLPVAEQLEDLTAKQHIYMIDYLNSWEIILRSQSQIPFPNPFPKYQSINLSNLQTEQPGNIIIYLSSLQTEQLLLQFSDQSATELLWA